MANTSTPKSVDGEHSAQLDERNQHRAKRQSPGRQSLCQANFQYITPKAALNSQGKQHFMFF